MELFQINWREAAKRLEERISLILDAGFMADLTIRVVYDGITEFKTHAVFLGMASPIFEEMLSPEYNDKPTKVIEIRDVKPEIVAYLLQFAYGRDICFTEPWAACELFTVADSYMMFDLKDLCLNYIYSTLDSSNVSLYLQLALRYNIISLRESALKLVRLKTKEVIEHEDFLEAEPVTLAVILEQNNLNAKDIELFHAVEKWIKSAISINGAGVRKPLCNFLLRRINYSSMTPQEFISGPVMSKLLNRKIIDSVFADFKLRKSAYFDDFLDLNNNAKTDKIFTVDVSSLLTKTVIKANAWRKIFFTVKEDVYLTEIHINTKEGPEKQHHHEKITIKIKDDESDFWDCECKFEGDVPYCSSTSVKIQESFLLLGMKRYVLEISTTGGYRDTVNLANIDLSDNNISIQFDKFAFWSSQLPLCSMVFKYFI